MAKDVKASFSTSRLRDANVKANVYKNYFNDLRAPKLGLFGHFDHIWPPQAYGETLLLAWMDQYLMGTDLNLEALPNALVVNNRQEEHRLATWPVKKHGKYVTFPSFADGRMASKAGDANAEIMLRPDASDEQRLTMKVSVCRAGRVGVAGPRRELTGTGTRTSRRALDEQQGREHS